MKREWDIGGVARERQRSDTNQCEHQVHNHQQQQQPPRPLCLSLGERDRNRVTGKIVPQRTQHLVSCYRDRNTSHHLQVVEAKATRVPCQYDSALRGTGRTEQGRQLWLCAFFCLSHTPAFLHCFSHRYRCCSKE